jgi:hypothetical protein
MSSAVQKRPKRSRKRAAPTLPERREMSLGEKRRRTAQVASGLRWKDIAATIEHRTGKTTTRQVLENVVKDSGRSKRVALCFADLMVERRAVFDGADPVEDPAAAMRYLFPEYGHLLVGGNGPATIESPDTATATESENAVAVAP